MCMPTCTRYVRDMHAAARALHSQGSAALPRTACMRQHGTFQSFTHYMHAAARALSLFHSQGSAAAPGHVCMSAATVCRTAAREFVGVAFEFVGVCVESGVSLGRPVSAVLRSCGPAGVVCAVMLSAGLCCHAVSDACARPGTAPHHLLAAATREVALVALVFLSVHLSLVALEAWARWRRVGEAVTIWRVGALAHCGAVLVARRASPCSPRCLPVLLAP